MGFSFYSYGSKFPFSRLGINRHNLLFSALNKLFNLPALVAGWKLGKTVFVDKHEKCFPRFQKMISVICGYGERFRIYRFKCGLTTNEIALLRTELLHQNILDTNNFLIYYVYLRGLIRAFFTQCDSSSKHLKLEIFSRNIFSLETRKISE